MVLNADNEHVMDISRGFEGRKVTYGIDHDADFRATNIRERGLLGTRFTRGGRVEARVRTGASRTPQPREPSRRDRHRARSIGISWDGVARGVTEVKPAYHRGVVVPWRGATIYDDSYNSNPYALSRTLDLMAQAEVNGRRIAVIGDMLELGEKELDYHRDAGKNIPRAIDVVVGVGPRSKTLLEGARGAGFSNDRLHHFDNAEDAGRFLVDFVRPGDLVLLKASRGIGLDKIVTMLAGTSADSGRRTTAAIATTR